jgi:hypothetical protein
VCSILSQLRYVVNIRILQRYGKFFAVPTSSFKALVPLMWNLNFLRSILGIFREFMKITREVGPTQSVRAPSWIRSHFASPAPNFVKWNVLSRWGGRKTWIETGTYLGETTEFLSRMSTLVLSIEPSAELASLAMEKFKQNRDVRIVVGTSEEVLGKTLSQLSDLQKIDVSFWLDGHFSSGITFLGPKETPIEDELSIIESCIREFSQVTIFIDDFRAFSTVKSKNENYPLRTFLVEWADRNQLEWTIEHDIFVMTNRPQG